ncbi:MAG: YeeE/YedE family protein, partial [Cylindrospermopsis raciborskii 1523720]|nr:YeeE/YedE family protein [Cylindrospermopsis raciborskii]
MKTYTQPQKLIVAIALGIFVALLILSGQYGWRQSVLFVIGVLLGITLYKSSFGFASAYRKLILNRDGQG